MSRNSSPRQATTNALHSSPLQQPTSDEAFHLSPFFALEHHAISPIYQGFLDRQSPLSPNVRPSAQDDGSHPVDEVDCSLLDDDGNPTLHDVRSNSLDFAG